MSETDSFIQEVTEELRRERLTRFFKRYGWIGIVAILVLVGGAAYYEWQKMRATAAAEAFGDAVEAALDRDSAEARREALAAIAVNGQQDILRDMLIATEAGDDPEAARAALDRVIGNAAAPDEWRDLAILRRAMLADGAATTDDRRRALEEIAVPGRPYRALAAEQLAYLALEEGRTDEALASLGALTTAADATESLRARAREVIAALGGTAPAAATPAGDDAAGGAETDDTDDLVGE